MTCQTRVQLVLRPAIPRQHESKMAAARTATRRGIKGILLILMLDEVEESRERNRKKWVRSWIARREKGCFH